MGALGSFPGGGGAKINGVEEILPVGDGQDILKSNFVDISCNGFLPGSYTNTTVTNNPVYLKAVPLGDSDKILAIWRLSSGSVLYAAIITTTGATMSIGTQTVVSSIGNSDMDPGSTMTAIVALSSTKVCIVFGGYDSSYKVFGVILSISGSTITVGTTTALNAAATTYIAVDKLDEDQIITIINNGSNSAGHIVSLWSISGMSISWKVNKTNVFGTPSNASNFLLKQIDDTSFFASALIYQSSQWKSVYTRITIKDKSTIESGTVFSSPAGFLASSPLTVVQLISKERIFVAQSDLSNTYVGIFRMLSSGELSGTVYSTQEDGLTKYPSFPYCPSWGAPYRMDDYLMVLSGASSSGNVMSLLVFDVSSMVPRVAFYSSVSSFNFRNDSKTTSSINPLKNGKVFCIYAGYNPGGIGKLVFDCERKVSKTGFGFKLTYSNGIALENGSNGDLIRVVSGK